MIVNILYILFTGKHRDKIYDMCNLYSACKFERCEKYKKVLNLFFVLKIFGYT